MSCDTRTSKKRAERKASDSQYEVSSRWARWRPLRTGRITSSARSKIATELHQVAKFLRRRHESLLRLTVVRLLLVPVAGLGASLPGMRTRSDAR